MPSGSTAVQHFIYPLTESSGYVFASGPITPEVYWRDALRSAVDEWQLTTGYRLIEPGDWVWAYFGGRVRSVCGVGTVESPVRWHEDSGRYSVKLRWNADLTQRLRDDPITYEAYRQQVQGAAVRANARTHRVFARWLRGHSPTALTEARKVKFVKREVLQRLGQQEFRRSLLKAYRGVCAVSRCQEQDVLQAAHIVPVRDGGHSVSNGVLLRADLHNLFDLGLLTVTSDFKAHIDPRIRERTYRRLEGREVSLPGDVDRGRMAAAYARHRRARRDQANR